MKKAIIFDNEIEAMAWDYAYNDFTGDVTKYKYERKPLTQTTTLTKAEYAELMGIPATISLDEEEVDNPEYTALGSSYTLNKYGLVVGDDLDTFNEETEEMEVPDNVVDITDLLKVISEEL